VNRWAARTTSTVAQNRDTGSGLGTLDNASSLRDPPVMTENPYAIPMDEFVARTRVAVSDQVEVQAEPQQPPGDWSTGVNPYGDGMSGDADGD